MLLPEPVNRVSLELIEHCVCLVCLDEPINVQPTDSNRALFMLHGGGHLNNGANRWYDKSMQVCHDGPKVKSLWCEWSELRASAGLY